MAENQNIEWKETWKDEYLKWICGFANAQGGKIYIGKNDSGNVVDVPNSKKLMENIPNKIQSTLGILADVNLLTESGKDCIEISVSPSSFPVNYKGEYHYRSGSTKQQLKGIALTEFLTSKTGVRWEDVPVFGVTADDLDKDSFDIFRREALRSKRMTKADLQMTNAELLDSLGLISENNSCLKRAAILLFHRTPEKWMPGCYTKIGKFGKGADLQYQDEVHGSLFLQADRVVDLIYLKYLKAPITYDNMTRVETYPFPKDAVREALYNALIHSCWSSGVPIQIRIEDDAMYISNDCIFPSDWTAETLMKRHRSRPYNPRIANAFFRAGYVESWGRGIQKICENCQEYGIDLPEYTVHSEDIMLKLTALKSAESSNSKVPNGTMDGTKDDTIEIKIISLIKEDSTITVSEMAKRLPISKRTIMREMNKLKEQGKIERKGGKRYGYWEIKE
ncbi:MAG: putative DNA binding domain-containing protein [Clostridiales bacterium]|nr:putative DNA binding domain-containing protein [Clostridiales bacterium]